MGNRACLAAALVVAVLAAAIPGLAQLLPRGTPLPGAPARVGPTAPPPARAGAGPVLRIGALLPLSGPSAWYGQEMRQGLELAVADLAPPPRPATPAATGPSATPAPETDPAKAPATGGRAGSPPASPGGAAPGAGPGAASAAPAGTARDGAAEAPSTPAGPPAVGVTLDVVDVEPLNLKDAEAGFTRLAGAGAPVVLTASPTPTLAVLPLATSRNVLLVHQGLPNERFPATSRTLLQLRPSPAARGAALAAYLVGRGLRRVSLVTPGDPFGKAVRASVAARLREGGTPLVADASLSLDAPDVAVQLARVARQRPDAVCLGFQGIELGEAARQLRGAGYQGLLLAVDDDPAAWLAAGPALDDVLVLSDDFAADPDSRGAIFAKAYQGKFGHAPSRFAANAYEAVLMLAEAARATMEAGSAAPGGSRLREALLARRHFPALAGGTLTVRDDGAIERPLALFAVEAGRARFVRHVAPDGRPPSETRLPPAGVVRLAWAPSVP